MTWMREDARSIAEALQETNNLAGDHIGVLAIMLSVIDTAANQEMTLSDDFTVDRAEKVIDRIGMSADELYDRADSIARNFHSGHVIIRGDEDYPEGLMRMEHPPNILYASGNLDFLDLPLVAVVGSRKITPEQYEAISDIGRSVAPVVSGLAPGTDHAAMSAALDAGRPVVGVLGSGLNYAFGQNDMKLTKRVESEGLLLSEYPLGVKPVAHRLLRRNEIIAGLSETFIACVADFRGGTYSGLRRAEKMGVPIMALPGSPALDDWLKRNPDCVFLTETPFPASLDHDESFVLPEFDPEDLDPWVQARMTSRNTEEDERRRLAEIARRFGIED